MAFIARIQKITPMDKDPASPMNTLAGEKLKNTKPIIVPANTLANRANGTFPQL